MGLDAVQNWCRRAGMRQGGFATILQKFCKFLPGIKKAASKPLFFYWILVGTAGFELATPCTPCIDHNQHKRMITLGLCYCNPWRNMRHMQQM